MARASGRSWKGPCRTPAAGQPIVHRATRGEDHTQEEPEVVRKRVANHQVTAHAATTLERIRLVRKGKRLTGHHRVFGAAYRLLDTNQPAPTVTRSGFRDFIHPNKNRVCTVRELARLQSFPDTYVFKGRRCDTYAQSRYVQQTQHEQ